MYCLATVQAGMWLDLNMKKTDQSYYEWKPTEDICRAVLWARDKDRKEIKLYDFQ